MPNSTAAKDTDAPVAIVSETFKNIVFSGRIDEPESEDEVLEVTVCDIHLTLCRANAYALGIPGAGLLACDYPTCRNLETPSVTVGEKRLYYIIT
jgi:hypothetical protein